MKYLADTEDVIPEDILEDAPIQDWSIKKLKPKTTVIVPIGDFEIITNEKLIIKSTKTKKIFLTITEDEIIIGNVDAEHIRLKH